MTITNTTKALTDEELGVVSGGRTLLELRIPGLTLRYFDNGVAVGASSWGSVVNDNGNTSSYRGWSGGAGGLVGF